ncbi:MAG: IS200/IS605 family transposase [Planctomycetales bacterium]
MAQSLAQIYLHIVFSTKDRRPFLQNETVREELHVYLQGICKNQGSPSLIVGGVEDHVHILCRFGRTSSVAELLRELKRDSSKWIKGRDAEQALFDWQDGYGAFSVSPSHVPALKRYIAEQAEHHRKETFQDEFRRLLRKYGVEFDERYVWG